MTVGGWPPFYRRAVMIGACGPACGHVIWVKWLATVRESRHDRALEGPAQAARHHRQRRRRRAVDRTRAGRGGKQALRGDSATVGGVPQAARREDTSSAGLRDSMHAETTHPRGWPAKP